MSKVDELFEQAMQLSEAEREELANRLYQSVDPDDGEWDPEFLAEIDERVARYERGETAARDAWEALEELRRKYSEPPGKAP
jgi:putative addiction module component (TIGR02574 family)